MIPNDRLSLAGYGVMQWAINALLLYNSTIRQGHNCMRRGVCGTLSAAVLILLAHCAEKIPETSMDGIYTADQAARGAGLFTSLCERCHSIQEFSGRSFDAIWAGVPAAALYTRIANTMPLDQPGSLGLPQVTALMAHIFAMNEMPTGNSPLVADIDWLMGITMARPDQ
tara:strand:- start:40 stop:546 length:507 start_codon:yes stop_codon:yes gene_type:complete